jgi:hypothetical protein
VANANARDRRRRSTSPDAFVDGDEAMTRSATIAAAASLLLAGSVGAQSWRTLDVARQAGDSTATQAQITYGTGTFGLRGGTSGLLYHMKLRYDASRTQPKHSFDLTSRKAQLGVDKSDVRFTGRKDNESGQLQLELSRTTPWDLTLDLGAVEADLDLTGLRLSKLKIESGASDGRVRFDSLNPIPMRDLQISLGAANFRADRLANANTREIRVDAGVGNVELDLGGQWTQDIELRAEITLGVVTVHVPSDVGVRVAVEKVIASFDHEGLIERDGEWVSPNWDSAKHKLRVSAKTIFGKLTIDRTGR